jgi:hypothetical protein
MLLLQLVPPDAALHFLLDALPAPCTLSALTDSVFLYCPAPPDLASENPPALAAAGTAFVSYLPLKADTVEARVVHKQLLGFVQRSDPR